VQNIFSGLRIKEFDLSNPSTSVTKVAEFKAFLGGGHAAYWRAAPPNPTPEHLGVTLEF